MTFFMRFRIIRFIHDCYGWNSKHRVQHAALRVVEAHVRSFPFEWEERTALRENLNNSKRLRVEGIYNKDRNIFLGRDTYNWYPDVYKLKDDLVIEVLGTCFGWRDRLETTFQWWKKQKQNIKNKLEFEETMTKARQFIEPFKPVQTAWLQAPPPKRDFVADDFLIR